MIPGHVFPPALGTRSDSLPPGPTVNPLWIAYRWYREPLGYLEELAERYGDPFTMRLPGLSRPLVLVSDPESVKEVFQDRGESLQAGRFYQSLRPFLGDHSILMLDGPPHVRKRKLLLPPFNGDRIRAHGETMMRFAEEAVTEWPDDRIFPFHRSMQRLTLRIIVRAIFGVTEGPRFEQLSALLADLMDWSGWMPLMLPFMQLDWGRFSPWGRFRRTQREVYAFLDEEIERRRASGGAHEDILSLLLAARDEQGHPMSDRELRGELLTLLFAGHETTASSLAWAMRWMLAHPEVEAKLREEIHACLQRGGRLAPAAVAELEYLDGFVKECLRFIPPAPMVGRLLTRPANIGGYTLPEGCVVACCIHLAQRRASVYAQPGEFRPERFVGARFKPEEFFPFGGGVRRCIGMFFAMYEMKVVLATLLARARLELVDQRIGVVRQITLRPSRGLRVRLVRRDG